MGSYITLCRDLRRTKCLGVAIDVMAMAVIRKRHGTHISLPSLVVTTLR